MAPPRPPELRSLPPSWLGTLGTPTEPPRMLSQPHPGSPVPTPGSPAWPPAPERHGVGPVWAPQTSPGLGTPTPSTKPPAGLKTPMGGIAPSRAELLGSPGTPGSPSCPPGPPWEGIWGRAQSPHGTAAPGEREGARGKAWGGFACRSVLTGCFISRREGGFAVLDGILMGSQAAGAWEKPALHCLGL